MSETRLVIPALGAVYRALAPITEPLIRLCAGLSMAAHAHAVIDRAEAEGVAHASAEVP